MRYRLSVLTALCTMAWACASSDARPQGMKVTEARIIEDAGHDDPEQEVIRRIDEMRTALADGAEPAATDARPPSPDQLERPSTDPHFVEIEDGETDAEVNGEYTVDYLVSLLDAKERTPAEEEAYRRLLALAGLDTPARAGSVERLLEQAREAAGRGDDREAQAMAAEALAILRNRTDPTIDRLFFAREVRSYGNAVLVENARFAPSEMVLVVVDLSDFACEEVAGTGADRLYHTRMTYRLAIYDTDGRLYWQHSEGPFEYQSSSRISTMFLPKKFRLPAGLTAGQYVIKAEIVDHLAGKQTQASADFAVR